MYCPRLSPHSYRPIAIALAASLAAAPVAALAHDLRVVHGDAPPEMPPPMRLYLEDARRLASDFGQRGGRVRGLLYTFKLWQPNTRIEVCFIDGEPELRQVFVETSLKWAAGTSLRLDFGDGSGYRVCTLPRPSDIRVSFNQAGHWSYVGTDSRNNNRNGPSLNIAMRGRLDALERVELQRLTLHEMGHALGLEHERQSPESPCGTEFDWPKVYDFARRNWAWTKDDVDHNMRMLVNRDRLLTTPYDPRSVMHYQFDAAVFARGVASPCYVGVNADMSEGDRETIKGAYPPAVAAVEQLQNRADSASKVLAGMSMSAPEVRKFGTELSDILVKAERAASLSFSLAGGTRGPTRSASPAPAADCAPGGARTAGAPEVLCRAATDGSSLVIDVGPRR